jgi:hypothetical protein
MDKQNVVSHTCRGEAHQHVNPTAKSNQPSDLVTSIVANLGTLINQNTGKGCEMNALLLQYFLENEILKKPAEVKTAEKKTPTSMDCSV